MSIMRKALKSSKAVIHILAFGLNALMVSEKKKIHHSPEMQLMSSIRAGKLYLIDLTLPCQQLPNTKLLPLFLGCSLIMTCLWA